MRRLLLAIAVLLGGCAHGGPLLILKHADTSLVSPAWVPKDRRLWACKRLKLVTGEYERQFIILRCGENLFVAVDYLTRNEVSRGEWWDTRFLPGKGN